MGDGIAGRAKALGLSGGMGGFMGAAAVGPMRKVMGKLSSRSPGKARRPKRRRTGFYDLRFHGTTDAGDEIMIQVTGRPRPGLRVDVEDPRRGGDDADGVRRRRWVLDSGHSARRSVRRRIGRSTPGLTFDVL